MSDIPILGAQQGERRVEVKREARLVIVSEREKLELQPRTVHIPWAIWKQVASVILQHEVAIELSGLADAPPPAPPPAV